MIEYLFKTKKEENRSIIYQGVGLAQGFGDRPFHYVSKTAAHIPVFFYVYFRIVDQLL